MAGPHPVSPSPAGGACKGKIEKFRACPWGFTFMTLVASYSLDNHPIIVGDILESRPDDSLNYQPFHVPTHSDINRVSVPATGYIVSGLVQKVTKLSDRLVLAWAGNKISARALAKDLLGESNHQSFGMIEKKLNSWAKEAGFDLYVTGLYLLERRGNEASIARFGWDSSTGWQTQQTSVPGYGNVYYGGTGGPSFLKVLANASHLNNLNASLDKSLLTTLAHLSKMAGDQMRTSAGVSELFGGAFECAAYFDGRLQKLSDVTYHFWDASLTASGETKIGMHAIFKVKYVDDLLLIRKVSFSAIADQGVIEADELYVIAPPYRVIGTRERKQLEESIQLPNISSQFSVFYVHLPGQQGNDVYTMVHKASTSGSRAVEYNINAGEMTIAIREEVHQRISSYLRSRNQEKAVEP